MVADPRRATEKARRVELLLRKQAACSRASGGARESGRPGRSLSHWRSLPASRRRRGRRSSRTSSSEACRRRRWWWCTAAQVCPGRCARPGPACSCLIRGKATAVGNGLDCVGEHAENVKPRCLSEKLHQLSQLKAVVRCHGVAAFPTDVKRLAANGRLAPLAGRSIWLDKIVDRCSGCLARSHANLNAPGRGA